MLFSFNSERKEIEMEEKEIFPGINPFKSNASIPSSRQELQFGVVKEKINPFLAAKAESSTFLSINPNPFAINLPSSEQPKQPLQPPTFNLEKSETNFSLFETAKPQVENLFMKQTIERIDQNKLSQENPFLSNLKPLSSSQSMSNENPFFSSKPIKSSFGKVDFQNPFEENAIKNPFGKAEIKKPFGKTDIKSRLGLKKRQEAKGKENFFICLSHFTIPFFHISEIKLCYFSSTLCIYIHIIFSFNVIYLDIN